MARMKCQTEVVRQIFNTKQRNIMKQKLGIKTLKITSSAINKVNNFDPWKYLSIYNSLVLYDTVKFRGNGSSSLFQESIIPGSCYLSYTLVQMVS